MVLIRMRGRVRISVCDAPVTHQLRNRGLGTRTRDARHKFATICYSTSADAAVPFFSTKGPGIWSQGSGWGSGQGRMAGVSETLTVRVWVMRVCGYGSRCVRGL